MKNVNRSIAVGAYVLAILALSSVQAAGAMKPGDKAPDAVFRDRSGKAYTLSDITGANKDAAKGVIVSFFATWCTPCREELPLFNSMTKELNRKGIQIVLVDVKENFGAIDTLIRELNIDGPLVLSDREGKAAEAYRIRFLPTTFFISADGTIKDIIFGGVLDKEELIESTKKITR